MEKEKLKDLEGFQSVNLNDGQVLRERRVILGLTQQAAADRAKIPLQSYQQFESGKRKIRRASFQIACQVLEALGMDIAAFHHNSYAFGERVFLKDDELHYKKTGKPVSYDPSDAEEIP